MGRDGAIESGSSGRGVLCAVPGAEGEPDSPTSSASTTPRMPNIPLPLVPPSDVARTMQAGSKGFSSNRAFHFRHLINAKHDISYHATLRLQLAIQKLNSNEYARILNVRVNSETARLAARRTLTRAGGSLASGNHETSLR